MAFRSAAVAMWSARGPHRCAVAMRQLPQRLTSLPVGWVMAFRPNQGLPPVQSAKAQLQEAGAEMIRLGPLTRDAVAEIATDVLGAEPDEELLQRPSESMEARSSSWSSSAALALNDLGISRAGGLLSVCR
jgi:hypothetical protein